MGRQSQQLQNEIVEGFERLNSRLLSIEELRKAESITESPVEISPESSNSARQNSSLDSQKLESQIYIAKLRQAGPPSVLDRKNMYINDVPS